MRLLKTSAYARTCALFIKYQSMVTLISWVSALAILIAPHFSEAWHRMVTSNHLLGSILDWYSQGTAWAYISLAMGLPVALYSQAQKRQGNVSANHYPFDLREVELTDIVARGLYPVNLREEFMFWLHRYFDLYLSTTWIFWMVGLIHYLMT